MKKRIIVHIGTHKTGTTSIQDALEAGRDVLMRRGVLYPLTNREPWPELSKHTSAFAAAKSRDPELIRREHDTLLAEFSASGCHTMIISEEGFSEPEDYCTGFFRSLAREFEVTAVCYFRRQDLFVESLYNQFVRERTRREARSINQFCRAPNVRSRLKYHAILGQWQAAGIRPLALDFDQAVRGEGLLDSFLSVTGLTGAELAEKPSNRSPDMHLILALARMNTMGLELELRPLIEAARAMNERFRRPRLSHLLGSAERSRLIQEFAEENARLSADYGVSFSASLPQDEAVLPLTEPDPNYLLSLLALVSAKRRPQ